MKSRNNANDLANKLIKRYGLDKALNIAKILTKILEEKKSSSQPSISFGPNPAQIKVIASSMRGGKVLDFEDIGKILGDKFGSSDPKGNLRISLLDWNRIIFRRASDERGVRKWRLTDYGEELATHLSSDIELTSVEKTLLAGLYLNDSITRAVYDIFKGKKITRREGIELLAKQANELGITKKQAEWYIGEKTSALVRLGLLQRIRGKETIYT